MPDKHSYEEELRTFEKLVSMAIDVSDESGGINTSTLKIEATKVYTRLTLSSMTINSILPNNKINQSTLWDFSSIAVLTRTFMETTHRYLYLCNPDDDEEERFFRHKLYYYHINSEKYRLYSELKLDLNILLEFEEKLPLAKNELMESIVYKKLNKQMQKKVRSENTEMHLTDIEIADKYKLVYGHFKSTYRLLSNHSHGSPFSTTSQSNERGRGFKNSAEKYYLALSLMLLNRYLSKSIIMQVKLLNLDDVCSKPLYYAENVFEK